MINSDIEFYSKKSNLLKLVPSDDSNNNKPLFYKPDFTFYATIIKLLKTTADFNEPICKLISLGIISLLTKIQFSPSFDF